MLPNPSDLYRHAQQKSASLKPLFTAKIVLDSQTTQYIFDGLESGDDKIVVETYESPAHGLLAYYRDELGRAIEANGTQITDSRLVNDAITLKTPKQYYAIAAAQIDSDGQIDKESTRRPKLLSLVEDEPNTAIPGKRKICVFDDGTQLEVWRVGEGLEPALIFLDFEGKSTPFPCGKSEIEGKKYIL